MSCPGFKFLRVHNTNRRVMGGTHYMGSHSRTLSAEAVARGVTQTEQEVQCRYSCTHPDVGRERGAPEGAMETLLCIWLTTHLKTFNMSACRRPSAL